MKALARKLIAGLLAVGITMAHPSACVAIMRCVAMQTQQATPCCNRTAPATCEHCAIQQASAAEPSQPSTARTIVQCTLILPAAMQPNDAGQFLQATLCFSLDSPRGGSTDLIHMHCQLTA